MLESTDKKLVATSSHEADYDQSTGDLFAGLKRYFLSSAFSDLTIRTADQEFKVHKLVVCSQSEHFDRACKGPWKETTENVIDFKKDDPRAIEAMIHFMYGFDYDSSGSDHGRTSPMLFNIKVYQVADLYFVPLLKQRAKEKFESIATACWQMDDFPTAIAEAYERTTEKDRGLRDILVRISDEHIDELQKNDDFRYVLGKTLGFAADLVQKLTQKRSTSPSLRKYECPSCCVQWLLEPHIDRSVQYCPFCRRSGSDWIIR